MIYVPLRNGLASALMLGLFLTAASGSWAQTADIEPNQTCATAQNLSAAVLPSVIQGSLDSPPVTPDIDFYRFSAAPGSLIVINLDGRWTGGGTLSDPLLAVFDGNCGLLGYNDDHNGTSSRLEISVPASGSFVVAATSYGDWDFVGNGGYSGTYRLTVERQPTARAIGGQVLDAVTGAPLTYVNVYLYRSSGEHMGWTQTDAQGAFRFESGSYVVYDTLTPGAYEIRLDFGGYEPITAGPYNLADGQDLDVGAISLQRLPAVGSIRGRLVDEITGVPLAGGAPLYTQVALYYCGNSWGCSYRGAQAPAADGTFRFEAYPHDPFPPGIYRLEASAHQYQVTSSEIFTVADGQHFDFGDFRVKSMPVRIYLGESCASIPVEGGDCQFTMRVVNGSPTRLEGEAWTIVRATPTGSPAQSTIFQVENPRTLSVAPGASTIVPFTVHVPGTVPGGAYICVQGFAAQKPHEFNTLGSHELFCIVKERDGFIQVPEERKRELFRQSHGIR